MAWPLQLVFGVSEGCRVPLHVLGDPGHRCHRRDNENLVVLHGIPDRGFLLSMVWYGFADQAAEEST